MSMSSLTFVSFKPDNGQFVALLPMEQLISSELEPEDIVKQAAQVYKHSITKMRCLVAEIQSIRIDSKFLPARKVWQLGDAIFELKDNLEKLSLQIDGLYDHLIRDLDVKRKWLEKVIILRRYLPQKDAIPESLNWGRCEKGTRRVAERLQKGHALNEH